MGACLHEPCCLEGICHYMAYAEYAWSHVEPCACVRMETASVAQREEQAWRPSGACMSA